MFAVGVLWQHLMMPGVEPDSRIHRRLVDTLYVDAMLLADEARAYFDDAGREDRDTLDPITRVSFSCESLKVTTRLMHIIAWLLTQRAVDAGEMDRSEALDASRRLGPTPLSDPALVGAMPVQARLLIDHSTNLYRRVARLDDAQAGEIIRVSPARSMLDRLEATF